MARKKAAASSGPSQGTIGVEIDGPRATAVSVVGGVVESVRVVTANDGLEALSRCLSGLRTGDPVRVVLASPAVKCTLVDVTPELANRRTFTQHALRALGSPEGYSVSAVVTDITALTSSRLAAGLAVALPSSQVASVYEVLALMGREGEVVGVPATALPLDGLSLAVRSRSVDLTLVGRGQPLGHIVLDAPGMESLIMGLGGDMARDRVLAAVSGSTGDPLAAAEVARWVDTIAHGCELATAAWRRLGIPVPSRITVYGAGAAATGLLPALKRRGFTPTPTALTKSFTSGTLTERLEMLPAFLAGVTYSQGFPASAFLPPSSKSTTRQTRKTKRTRMVLGTAVATAAAFAVVSFGPLALATAYEMVWSRLADSRASAVSEAATGEDLVLAVRADQATQVVGGYTDFVTSTLEGVQSSVEDPLTITGLSVDSPAPSWNPTVHVTVSAPAGESELVSTWMATLDDLSTNPQVVPEVFSQNAGSLQVTVRLTPPVSAP